MAKRPNDPQLALAHRLVGRRVRWAYDACGKCGEMRVLRATADGMVAVEGFTGLFSPTAFVVVDDER